MHMNPVPAFFNFTKCREPDPFITGGSNAFKQKGGTPGAFSKISDLRYLLAAKGLTFTAQDEALRAMYRQGEANLIPQSNQAALTVDQRATALEVGGERKHLISIR